MAKRAQIAKSTSSGSRSQTRAPSKRPRSAALLWVVIAAVGVLVVGLVLLQSQLVRRPVESSGQTGEGTAWGPVGAPVTITAYSDFGCSHCRTFALDQGKKLRAEYEASGKVRFEFKHFLISSEVTGPAANAAECAADQGRFWDYHDILFTQQGVSANPFAKSALKQYGAQLGLDATKFDRCVDNNERLDKVYRDWSVGKGLGIAVTPTFIINGKKIQGAAPYADFKAAVDAAIKAAS